MAEEKKRARRTPDGESRPRAGRNPDPEGDADGTEVAEYRRRSRPVRVRRRRWDWLLALLRRLTPRRVAVLGIVLGILLAAHRLVFGGPLFVLSSSDQITVSGGQHVSAGDVISCFAVDLGRNIFYIPLHQRRLAIEQIPWVAHATVLRLWPNALQVRLTERVPVAFARVGTGVELVDAHGVLLPRPPAGSYNFPVLTDLAGTDPASDSDQDVQQRVRQVAVYLAMKNDLDAGGAHHSNEFSEIDLHDPSDLQTTIQLNGDPDAVVVHFGHEHFLDRYRLLTAHIQQWQASFAHLASVDLRYDGQAIINTGGGTPGGSPGATAAGPPSAAAPGAAAPRP